MLLSKSQYLMGLQCPKLLWVVFNEKERLPETDAFTQHTFYEGERVGEVAKLLFSGGIDVSADDFNTNLEETQRLISCSKPLFEAGFVADNLSARADILMPTDDGWDIIEVKSSSSVKDVNIDDLAFQKYVYEMAGLKIRKCFLMHVNNQYIKYGEIKPESLFVQNDVTEDVRSSQVGVEERIKYMFSVIEGSEPEVKIGPGCKEPYTCSLKGECWSFLPESGVDGLCCGGKKTFDLMEKGIYCIKDIPEDYKLTARQKIQKLCEENEGLHFDRENINNWLAGLNYPLYYLDFETFNTAIPIFDGTKPYQQIPFQFSLHVQYEPGGELEHFSFLAGGKKDPRPELLKRMWELIGEDGSIVVYNQSFEIGRLKEMAEAFPDYKDRVESLISRFVDLIVPFRKFWFYKNCQKGSTSIKKVLPAVTGESYDDMEIGDGGTASLEYLRITFGDYYGNLPDEEEVKRVRDALEKYCGLDTEGMAWIVDGLRRKSFEF